MEAIDNYGYYGSDDDIRKSFEEYIVRLLSLVYNHYSEETDELKAEGGLYLATLRTSVTVTPGH